jgi:hypothetical protein
MSKRNMLALLKQARCLPLLLIAASRRIGGVARNNGKWAARLLGWVIVQVAIIILRDMLGPWIHEALERGCPWVSELVHSLTTSNRGRIG